MIDRPAYSYRADPAVPDFDDARPVFVFDGTCVLCSGGAAWLMRHDRRRVVRFASAQSALGQALYAHYRMPLDESYLLIADGRAWAKTDGYVQLASLLGGGWRLFVVARFVPRPLRDWAYDLVARNRYRWFGRAEHCALLSAEQRGRLIEAHPPLH